MFTTTTTDRRERLDQITHQLEAGIAAIQSSDQFKQYLRAAATFHNYSFNNVLLIVAQCPTATHIAGYNAWKKLGRQVRKGEKAIRIYAPLTRRVDQATAADTKQDRFVVGYKAAPVFDIAQTDGDDLPTIEPPRLDGEQGTDAFSVLETFATAQGLTVTTFDPDTHGDDTRSTYNGYYSHDRKLIFVKRNAPAQMLKTLVHELAHHLDPKLADADRPEAETVAEAAAFMVAAYLDIDTSTYSFPYIALWAGAENGTDILKRAMQRTQQIVHTLIDALHPNTDTTAADQEIAATA